jgi:ferredoxin-type protein NapF
VPQRPPGARAEADFTEACTRCDDCIRACPQAILVRGRGGFPSVDFTLGGCTFCGACAAACTTGAFALPATAWQLRATIGPGCVETKGVACRLCQDPCEANAIRFRPAPGGRYEPAITPACTGCGTCVALCPAAAITINTPCSQTEHAA